MNKLQKYWIWLFLLIFMIPILINNKYIFASIMILLAITIFCKKIKIKNFAIILFIISFIIRLVICLLIDTYPESDFAILLNASKSLNSGDLSFNNTSYFMYWGYQIGFVFIQSLFLKIINNILFLKIINCLVTSFICVLIYKIAKEFIEDEYAKIVSIFYSIMVFPLTYVTVLTNQHLSAMLIYIAIYLLIKKKTNLKEYQKYIIVGSLISLGNIIRPEGIITIFAILLTMIITIKKKEIKNTIKKISILLITYYGVFFICSNIFIISGIGPYGLSNNAPYWKFVLGFNHETKGQYSAEDGAIIGKEAEAWQLVKERIEVKPTKTIKLFINKSNEFWNSTALYWQFNNSFNKNYKIGKYNVESNTIIEALVKYNNSCLTIMYLLMIIGIYNFTKNKKKNKIILLLINIVFVTFGVYLLIEVQARYAYFVQITTVILMALGIKYISEVYNKYKLNQ